VKKRLGRRHEKPIDQQNPVIPVPLGKSIGRRKATRICTILERTFTTFFGREVYDDKS